MYVQKAPEEDICDQGPSDEDDEVIVNHPVSEVWPSIMFCDEWYEIKRSNLLVVSYPSDIK